MTGDMVADRALPATHKRDSGRPSGLAFVAIAGLALTVVIDIWAAVAHALRASYVARVLDGTVRYAAAEAFPYDNRVHGSGIAFLLTFLATGVVFIAWFAVVIRRLHAARPDTFRFGAGWAIGGWFVPIFDLVQPKLMMNDAWRAATGRERAVPKIVHFWWALFVLAHLTVVVGAEIVGQAHSDGYAFVRGDRVMAAGLAVAAVAAVLAIVVVARLDVLARHVEPEPAGPQPGGQQPAAMVFNPPPGWPAPPLGWVPPPGWQPDPSWPPAPYGWQFWVPAGSPRAFPP